MTPVKKQLIFHLMYIFRIHVKDTVLNTNIKVHTYIANSVIYMHLKDILKGI